MSIIVKPYTFSAGAVILASEHNSDFDTMYSDYNGNITNSNISNSAAIVYSKLDLTGGIVNADVNASAAIVASKLVLTSPGAIGTTAPAAGKFTTLEATSTLKLGTTNQGDIIYDNGTSLVRLTPGTSGQFLKTQGSSANPTWSSLKSTLIGSIAAFPSGSTRVVSFSGGIISASADISTPLPFACTIRNFYIRATQTTANTVAATIRVNDSDTSIVATIASTENVASDTTHSVSMNAGDRIGIYINNGRSANQDLTWSIEIG